MDPMMTADPNAAPGQTPEELAKIQLVAQMLAKSQSPGGGLPAGVLQRQAAMQGLTNMAHQGNPALGGIADLAMAAGYRKPNPNSSAPLPGQVGPPAPGQTSFDPSLMDKIKDMLGGLGLSGGGAPPVA